MFAINFTVLVTDTAGCQVMPIERYAINSKPIIGSSFNIITLMTTEVEPNLSDLFGQNLLVLFD